MRVFYMREIDMGDKIFLGAPKGVSCFVFGTSGLGKSWLATELAFDLSAGTNITGLSTARKSLRVLFSPLRDPETLILERLEILKKNNETRENIDLATLEILSGIDLFGFIPNYDVVIIDDFDMLHDGTYLSANKTLQRLMGIARQNCVSLFITGNLWIAEEFGEEKELSWYLLVDQTVPIVADFSRHEKIDSVRIFELSKNISGTIPQKRQYAIGEGGHLIYTPLALVSQ